MNLLKAMKFKKKAHFFHFMIQLRVICLRTKVPCHRKKCCPLPESLYEKPWFDSPHSKIPREFNIWSIRVDLIDCFAYNGDRPG